MNIFFLEYHDPLFSIILFFVLIFIVTFFSYWVGRYKRREDTRRLDKFIKQFRSLPAKKELKELVKVGELPQESWLLLAHSHSSSGDYEKSIEIYNEMLSDDRSSKVEILFLLGKTYFRAGFLERSKEIFLEILKNNPRTPHALNYLLLVYEQMQDYKQAIEVLEPLDELGENITPNLAYLNSIMIMGDLTLSNDKKVEKLLKIYQENHQLTHLIFEHLFRIDAQVAWVNLDNSKTYLLSDILWRLPAKDLDLDIIGKNSYLRELYSARGDISLADKSSIFELDVLINLNSKANVTIEFSYICGECQDTQPFAFHRCSSCHTIDSLQIELHLAKNHQRDFSEEYNSFQ